MRVPQGVCFRALDRLRLQISYLNVEFNLGPGGESEETQQALEKAASLPSMFDAAGVEQSGLDIRGPRVTKMPPLSRVGLALPEEKRLVWLSDGNYDWGIEGVVEPDGDKYVRPELADYSQEFMQEVGVGINVGSADSPAKLFIEPATVERFEQLQGRQKKKLKGYWGRDLAIAKQTWSGLRQRHSGGVELKGVGFKVFQNSEDELRFSLGMANDIIYKLKPEWKDLVDIKVINPIEVRVEGCKQIVGNVLSQMERLRKPDVYKNKGVNIIGKEYRLKSVK